MAMGIWSTGLERTSLFVNQSAAGKLSFQITPGGSGIIANTLTFVAGETIHAALVAHSTTDRRLFYNGGDKQTDTVADTVNWSAFNTLMLGVRVNAAPTSYLNGGLLWSAVWDIGLPDPAIVDLSRGANPWVMERFRPNLKVFCPFSMADPVPYNWVDGMPFIIGGTPTRSPAINRLLIDA